MGDAMRKSCAANADSCEGSTQVPVTGWLAMFADTTASRQTHGGPFASGSDVVQRRLRESDNQVAILKIIQLIGEYSCRG